MPYVNKPRPYKKEYEQQKERGEHENRMERQSARRAVDKTGKDAVVSIDALEARIVATQKSV